MFANVLVEIKSKKVDKTFTYKIPDKLINEVCVGSLVTIPFGKRELEGYVLKILDSCDIEDIKEIKGLKKNEIVLNEEMIELGYFLQEKTLCSLSCSIQSMLPKALKAKKGVNIKKKYISYLIRTKKDEHLSKPNQIAILNLFENNREVKLKDAEEISASSVKTLIKNGYLEIIKKEVNRFNLKESMYNNEKTLTIEQENALKKIRQFYNKKTTILLHGVTGSGKTLVYIEAIKDVLKNNKTALVLVPEISLTPQLIDRFNSYFKGSIAVLHSHLSEGEKYDEWRKINEGKVSIVIGARSAIFAP